MEIIDVVSGLGNAPPETLMGLTFVAVLTIGLLTALAFYTFFKSKGKDAATLESAVRALIQRDDRTAAREDKLQRTVDSLAKSVQTLTSSVEILRTMVVKVESIEEAVMDTQTKVSILPEVLTLLASMQENLERLEQKFDTAFEELRQELKEREPSES